MNAEAVPSSTVTCLLAVTRDGGTLAPDEVPRLPSGGPVRTIDTDGLRAIACDLDRDVLAALEDPAEAGIDALAAVARAHDEALAMLATRVTLLPLRLGTVVADDEVASGLLRRNAAALHGELDRVDGHTEWAVTVHGDVPTEQGHPSRQEAAVTGRAYLERRQASLRAREEDRQARSELATGIHSRLAAHATADDVVTSRPVTDVQPPLLHGVYLLDAAQQTRLGMLVDELRAEHPGLNLTVTGPWPPYHFTSVQLTTRASDAVDE